MRIELFGRVDQSNVSPLGEFESTSLVMDCFQATKRIKSGVSPQLSETEESLDENYPVLAFALNRTAWTQQLGKLPGATDRRWFKLTLQDSKGSGPPVALAGEGDEATPNFELVEASVADDAVQQSLNGLVATHFEGRSTDVAQIEALVGGAVFGKRSLLASVVDVGQGSLAALHAAGDRSVLFFDLGWPTMFHRASAPKSKPQLYDDNTPVVLSHWDWDHWGLAIEKAGWSSKAKSWRITWNGPALNRPWVVPGVGKKWGDVSFNPIHWRLALALARKKQLFRWPSGSADIPCDLLTIYRTAGGKKGDRNQHGLAMVIDNTKKAKRNKTPRRAILLPGDSDYVNLPFLNPASPYRFCGLAATHHGAKFTSSALPRAAVPAWLAYSVGLPNSYKHPRRFAQYRYVRAGWSYQAFTSHRVRQAGAASDLSISGAVLLTTERHRLLPSIASGVAWLGAQ